MAPRVALVLVLGGCSQIFGLDRPAGPDAPPDTDTDFDSWPDAKDNCAGITNRGQEDDDKDGVGNVCDPRPGEFDLVVAQDLFLDAAGTAWTTLGTWTKKPGAWQSPPSADGGSLIYGTQLRLTKPAIQVGFTIDDIDANAQAEIQIHLDDTVGVSDCTLRHEPNSGDTMLLHAAGMTGTNNLSALGSGTSYVTTFSRSIDVTKCSLGDLESIQIPNDTADELTPLVRIVLDDMQVTIHHVTIYQVKL